MIAEFQQIEDELNASYESNDASVIETFLNED